MRFANFPNFFNRHLRDACNHLKRQFFLQHIEDSRDTPLLKSLLKTVLKYSFAKQLLIPLNPDHIHHLAFMCLQKVFHHIMGYDSETLPQNIFAVVVLLKIIPLHSRSIYGIIIMYDLIDSAVHQRNTSIVFTIFSVFFHVSPKGEAVRMEMNAEGKGVTL